MLQAGLSSNKQEPMTLRDYLQRHSHKKKMRSAAQSGKQILDIEIKPSIQFMNRIKDFKNFLQQKISDKKLKMQIEKKILELTTLFQKTLEQQKNIDVIKYQAKAEKQILSQSSTEPYCPLQANKLLTQPRIPQYEMKTSFEVSNSSIPLEKLAPLKSGRFQTKLSINVEDSHEIRPSIIHLPSNEQFLKNKSSQWVRSSNIIEQKDGDGDQIPHQSQKNTNQTLKQKVRTEKEKKEKEKMKLKNQTNNYQPPKISKKASGFDYSVRNFEI